jgi:S1-C subfamily serine protease
VMERSDDRGEQGPESGAKAFLARNVLWIIISLLVFNFLLVYWGTVNWGIYGARANIFRWDAQKSASGGNGQGPDPISSPALRLTCSDDDLASAYASVRPAVVNVTADKVTQRRGGISAGSVLFDDPSVRFVEEQSLGSGIIVDPRGFIVTNAHVASKAENMKVVVFGFERREYAAEIIRKDLSNDIAVLKIYPRDPLPAAILGDSDMIKVADRVLAVGSPFGLEQTVTAGVISDDSRSLLIEGEAYQDMIQTDAAINRGNSGGPLVNLKGEVIGMNTAIYAPTGVFTGVAFAIPINRVKPVLKKALAR